MINKKHKKIVNNYAQQKSKHLDKLKQIIVKLKSKQIKGDFLKNF